MVSWLERAAVIAYKTLLFALRVGLRRKRYEHFPCRMALYLGLNGRFLTFFQAHAKIEAQSVECWRGRCWASTVLMDEASEGLVIYGRLVRMKNVLFGYAAIA